jgi:hypothetical protein
MRIRTLVLFGLLIKSQYFHLTRVVLPEKEIQFEQEISDFNPKDHKSEQLILGRQKSLMFRRRLIYSITREVHGTIRQQLQEKK